VISPRRLPTKSEVLVGKPSRKLRLTMVRSALTVRIADRVLDDGAFGHARIVGHLVHEVSDAQLDAPCAMRRSRATLSAPSAAAVAANPTAMAHTLPRVAVCVDLDDNAELIRAIHHRFVPARGHLVLTVGPKAGAVEDLIRGMLVGLHVLWRLPPRLRPGRVPLGGEDRAIAEWEISWALTASASRACGCSTPTTRACSGGAGYATQPSVRACG
jgi:peptidyl-tRNA hydrolase